MLNREEIRLKVPHGYQHKIAEKAGTSQAAVSKYLKGKSNSEKIEMAVLEILAELSQRKKQLLDQII